MSIKGISFEPRITVGNLANFLALAATLVVLFVRRDKDLEALSENDRKQDMRIESVQEQVHTLKTESGKVSTSIEFIRQALMEIKMDIKDVKTSTAK